MIEVAFTISWQQALILALLWVLLAPLMSMLGRDAYRYLKGKIK